MEPKNAWVLFCATGAPEYYLLFKGPGETAPPPENA